MSEHLAQAECEEYGAGDDVFHVKHSPLPCGKCGKTVENSVNDCYNIKELGVCTLSLYYIRFRGWPNG